MTTAAAPPLIVPAVDVDDMPALDQPDERACELRFDDDADLRQCGRPAAWAVSTDCDDCADGPETALLCDPCKYSYVDTGIGLACGCGEIVTVTWIERIR